MSCFCIILSSVNKLNCLLLDCWECEFFCGRVVAIDQRGYGDSDKPSSVSSYDVDKLVNDLKGLVAALGLYTRSQLVHRLPLCVYVCVCVCGRVCVCVGGGGGKKKIKLFNFVLW